MEENRVAANTLAHLANCKWRGREEERGREIERDRERKRDREREREYAQFAQLANDSCQAFTMRVGN